MRLITGADIIDFYNGRDDILVLDADGEYSSIDYSDIAAGDTTAYATATTDDGDEVRILLERSTLVDGEWFPGAIDEDGNLNPGDANDMAAIINNDANLHILVAAQQVKDATEAWEEAAATADARAMDRAHAVANVVTLCSGNQSMAARILRLDQSTVNKLVKKARAAA